jgi:tRNA G37 N-methylase Trm5
MSGTKKDFLFRFLSPAIRNLLRFDEEALYSTTDQLTADKICKDILKFVSTSGVITDATACIGGSCASFAKVFSKVHAIEIDSKKYDYLRHNMLIMGFREVVHCICGDALQVCPRLKQDVIFIDPPWGGPEYKLSSKISLFLSGRPLADVCCELSVYTHYIAIKVPTNFDENAFLAAVEGTLVRVHRNVHLRKMHLLIFETKNKLV